MENPPAPGHQDMAGFSNIKVGSQTEWSLLVEKQEGMQIITGKSNWGLLV